jgi:hypothetical protein
MSLANNPSFAEPSARVESAQRSVGRMIGLVLSLSHASVVLRN